MFGYLVFNLVSVGFLFIIYFELGRFSFRKVLMFFFMVIWLMYRKIGCVVLSMLLCCVVKMFRLMLCVYSMLLVML